MGIKCFGHWKAKVAETIQIEIHDGIPIALGVKQTFPKSTFLRKLVKLSWERQIKGMEIELNCEE